MLVVKNGAEYFAFKNDAETQKLYDHLRSLPYAYAELINVSLSLTDFYDEEFEDKTGNLRTIRELREEIAALKSAAEYSATVNR